MKQKNGRKIWPDIIKLGIFILLVLVIANWSYFAKQTSAWWIYDVLNKDTSTTITQEVISGKPDTLAIPSLGLEAPLVYVTETDEVTFQRGLEQGVVHYPSTTLPGEIGNAYYFGHSSDYAFKKGNYKTVFAILPKIEAGAEIYITDHSGQQFTYKVREKKVVEPKDVSVLSQGDGKEKLLTLQTSWPLGTALRRYVVIAEIDT